MDTVRTRARDHRRTGSACSYCPAEGPRIGVTVSTVLFGWRLINNRHRHLLNDLYALLPHSRKDAKLDTKTKLYQLNELADLYNCNNVLFFEARKGKDLYIWMSKAPNGPTVKMHMQNCTPKIKPQNQLQLTASSAYDVRVALSWQLSERLTADPLL